MDSRRATAVRGSGTAVRPDSLLGLLVLSRLRSL